MDSPDEDGQQAEANGDAAKVTVNQEVDSIMEVLGKKGEDTVALLRELLADETKIQSKDLKLKQVLIEILFLKYGSQSLEHVSRGIEKIKPVLEEQFKDQKEAQQHATLTVFKAFSMDKLSAQKFEQENIYHVRSKVVNLAEKLNVSGVFQAAPIIEWCIAELSSHCTPEAPVDLDFVHCHLILDLLKLALSQRSNIVYRYVQEKNKVAEVKIETPYEKRKREQEMAERGEEEQVKKEEPPKEKTAQEIQEEQQAIHKQFGEQYAKAMIEEQELIRGTLALVDQNNQGHALDALRDKVALLTNSF